MTSQDASKRKICGNSETSGVCLILRLIQRSQSPGGTVRRSLNRADSEKELRPSLILTSISVWLQQHTHLQTHTHIQEYLDHGQSEGAPPFTISDWFRPRYEPNVSVVEQQREFLSHGDFSFFSKWLDGFSRTLEKLGRTLEPCWSTLT